MFGINKAKQKNLVVSESQNFVKILTDLEQLLAKNNKMAQAEIVQQSLELLLSEDIDAFIKSINGINYWGGSGAIWDVVLMDVSVNYTYEVLIVRLITLMQKTKIHNGKVKSIKKFLLSS